MIERPLSAAEDLKVHAVARVMLNGVIDNIQVSWVKLGVRLAQIALYAGVNDFGGTLMEENISRSAGADTGQGLAPEEMRELIEGCGRTAIRRSTLYETLEVFS